ncbi:MAG TPA: ATP-dependent DNA helicase [Tepidanaerobacteraceae bacterium]|nr:ATP-dependent DNA helicase [Tepidanaerobacteraceae bacterium]
MKEILNSQIKDALYRVVSGLANEPETRPQQIQMAQVIRRFLHFSQNTSGNLLLIEAGTGVGKSFAYLTALCEYMKNNLEKKAVIGTNTINLQEQLYQKDIPYVLRHYPGIVFNKAKGRNNYLCLRKLSDLDANLFAEDDAQEFKNKIYEWMENDPTHDGEKSNIPFDYDHKLWHAVESDGASCLDSICPHKKQCYFHRARAKLKDSNIIIANHALILSDYMQQVLPEYHLLILDEGHNFENNAFSVFTTIVKRYELLSIDAAFNTSHIQSALRSARALKKIEGIQKDIRNNTYDFFGSLKDGRYTAIEENQYAERILAALQQSMLILEKAYDNTTTPFLKAEVSKLAERIINLYQNIYDWVYQTQSNSVYWAEDNSIHYCPLDIADKLHGFWQSKNTIITSATLTVNHSFEPFKRSLGLNQKCFSLRYGSPFNYKENSLVYLPSNAPVPNSDKYIAYLCKTIENVLHRMPGKTFVLFTSYKMMQDVYNELYPKFPNLNWLLQGTGSKEMLLTKFREKPHSILFGTDTFWEGVDEELNCVIITKLPFEVPTTPIKEAQYELVKSRGGNYFMELSIPRCAIKLKQGTGRLIRNAYQKGIIVICDPRIQKPWGKIIKNTLPEMPWTDDLDHIDTYLSVG